MRYPTLSKSRTHELAPRFLSSGPESVEADVIWEGEGDGYDDEAVGQLSSRLESALEAFETSDEASDRDLFEGRLARDLFAQLSGLPVQTLDDPGFWRYLALAHFWWFITWRESGAFASGEPGKYLKYVDATNVSECVLTRAFLRARIAHVAGDVDLAAAVPNATDFWRSHVIRVRSGSAPAVVGAFAREQRDHRMATNELRSYARRLNRVWTNVVLHTYDDEEAARLVEELREA